MKKMMQTCYPLLQVYYTKFALKSQSNFEDSQKTIPIRKNSWVLGFLVQKWAISHICRYAKNIQGSITNKMKIQPVPPLGALAFIYIFFQNGEMKNEHHEKKVQLRWCRALL